MATQIDCATGFELRGVTRKPAADDVAVENGSTLMVWFAGVDAPLPVTVTKVTVEGDQKSITFVSPLIAKIELAD